MKKIIYSILFCSLAVFASGQVAIGKESVNGTATILDFNNTAGNTNGIILSAVNNLSGALSSAPPENNGTFLFDKSDKKVKMYENGVWIELSDSGNDSQIITNTSAESGGNQGVIIGASTSNARGVLVLEAQSKALILPQINTPHTAVKGPYPGMMCYDTASKSLAVFDGSSWNYWK
ncbi:MULTISPECIES: hypothetical protein [Chryseobacterium]|uniref:hypothetical protein n=1 Tax=Chryseobacterium TaxID=59732 RepID=UPI0012962336|nr:MULTISPECIES: hypothetical protein [Chryseobacterium]MDR6923710.1 hypothetical protein [Chryseobacterium sp. 2987]